jgi:hypothetical protein
MNSAPSSSSNVSRRTAQASIPQARNPIQAHEIISCSTIMAFRGPSALGNDNTDPPSLIQDKLPERTDVVSTEEWEPCSPVTDKPPSPPILLLATTVDLCVVER